MGFNSAFKGLNLIHSRNNSSKQNWNSWIS